MCINAPGSLIHIIPAIPFVHSLHYRIFAGINFSTMKIAIPTRNNVVDDHFGHCEYYTIFTINEDKQIVCSEIQASPEGCGCKSNIASVLEEKGVSLMLAGNMGEGAKNTLEAHHIHVIRGCTGPIAEVATAWLRGEISDSGESCSHHDGHHECQSHTDDKPLTFKVL